MTRQNMYEASLRNEPPCQRNAERKREACDEKHQSDEE